MLTNKCKQDFEKWFNSTQTDKSIHSLTAYDLKDYPLNMKWGIYIDFFESKQIIIDIQPILDYNNEFYTNILSFDGGITYLLKKDHEEIDTFNERDNMKEAREVSLKKANKLYNKYNQ